MSTSTKTRSPKEEERYKAAKLRRFFNKRYRKESDKDLMFSYRCAMVAYDPQVKRMQRYPSDPDKQRAVPFTDNMERDEVAYLRGLLQKRGLPTPSKDELEREKWAQVMAFGTAHGLINSDGTDPEMSLLPRPPVKVIIER